MKKLLLLVIVLKCIASFAQEPELVMPIGHTGPVHTSIFSPDGRFVLTAAYNDATARLWHRSTGKLVHTYQLHTQNITAIAFNKDGSLLATGSDDSSFAVWETVTGSIRYRKRSAESIRSLHFISGLSELMVTCGDSVRFYNMHDGLYKDGFYSENFSTYSKVFVSAKEDCIFIPAYFEKTLMICHILNGQKKVSTINEENQLSHIAVLNDNTLLTSSGKILVRRRLNGEVLFTRSYDFRIRNFSLSHDQSKIVLTSSETPYIEIRRLSDNRFIGKTGENSDQYFTRIKAQFSPISDHVIIAFDGDRAFTTEEVTDSLSNQKAFFTQLGYVYGFTFSPDGKQFIVNSGSNVKVWQVDQSEPAASLEGHANRKLFVQPLANDSLLLVGSEQTEVELWDLAKHQLVYTLHNEIEKVSKIIVSASDKNFLTFNDNNDIQLWETASGKLLQSIEAGRTTGSDDGNRNPLWLKTDDEEKQPSFTNSFTIPDYKFDHVIWSRDERLVIGTTTETESIPVWDLNTGSLVTNILLGTKGVLDVSLSNDNTKIAAIGRNGSGYIVDLAKKRIRHFGSTLNLGTETKVRFHEDGKYLFTNTDNGIYVWDTDNGRNVFHLDVGKASPILFLNEGKELVFSRKDSLYLFDFFTMKRKAVFAPQPEAIKSFRLQKRNSLLVEYETSPSFLIDLSSMSATSTGIITNQSATQTLSNDNAFLISAADNRITRRSVKSGIIESTFFTVDSTDHFVIVPGNYYKSSPDASMKLHYVTKELDIVSFEQLDIKYHRPDKVLQSIKNNDKALITAFTKAYEKRLKKLGIDTVQFSPGYSIPKTVFVNQLSIQPRQSNKELVLHIRGSDSLYNLTRFNIWVNEVPLFGIKGLSINKRKVFDTTITVTLCSGRNRVETAVTNINGAESYHMPVFVRYTPPVTVKEKVHFIGIGINHFKDRQYDLHWSVNDIRKLAAKLKEKYSDIIIDTLFDASVIKASILALKKKLQQLDVDDKVILSYSGHGLLSKDLDYYLSTYNINFNKPEENGLAYDELENMLDGISPRQKLMLIDACHSGEVDKEEIERIKAGTKTLDSLGTKTDTTNRSTIIIKKSKLGMANSFELMQSLFANVSRGTGATIISAAGGMQYAQERGDLQNGVFTYSIIEAFNSNSSLTVSQLKKIVGEAVVRLTNGLQKPTSRNETNNYDWRVW